MTADELGWLELAARQQMKRDAKSCDSLAAKFGGLNPDCAPAKRREIGPRAVAAMRRAARTVDAVQCDADGEQSLDPDEGRRNYAHGWSHQSLGYPRNEMVGIDARAGWDASDENMRTGCPPGTGLVGGLIHYNNTQGGVEP
jgi:hypothetical protein